MTNEEMAAELSRAGWRVQPPLTQENCKHERKNGWGHIRGDGTSRTEWTCQDCFKTGVWESPNPAKVF